MLALLLALAALAGAATSAPAVPTLYGFTMKRLDGPEQSLAAYRGEVLLLVNTASKCGFTPQYEALEKLYERRRERGFAVLGFPSNDFRQQEPGSDAEIAEFCKANYGVSFPMFSKIEVRGQDAPPLYRWLTGLPDPVGGPVKWNFQKYLIDRSGAVVARFDPAVPPDDPALLARIDSLLGAPRPVAEP
jgi:glutathione peroxidase